MTQVLWSTNHDSGTYDDWQGVPQFVHGFSVGGHSDTGAASSVIDTAHAHSGTYSLKMTSNAPPTGDAAARNFRFADVLGDDLPDEAVYECWYYFEQVSTPVNFWNIMQWKTRTGVSTSDPDWAINVFHTGAEMRLNVYDFHRATFLGDSGAGSFPINTWHRITVTYYFHPTNGRVSFALNGAVFYQENNVATKGSSPYTTYGKVNQWSVNNYTDANSPAIANIWVDDASIVGNPTGTPPSSAISTQLDDFNWGPNQTIIAQRASWAYYSIFVGDTGVLQTDAVPTYATLSSGTFGDGIWNTPFQSDQEVYITYGSVVNDTWLYTRLASVQTAPGMRGYELQWLASGALSIQPYANSSGLGSIASGTQVASPGDSIKLRCVGASIEAWYRAGAGAWTRILQGFDESLSGPGYIGLASRTTSRIDEFGGGTTNKIRNVATWTIRSG